ncbi:ribosome modulation factor [Thiococcus pfennigii]|uniref:ribosome modulation factor n=1 Tax=Thiococcus pfennigii TaxID=1057 RepID=UPI0019055A71|nr:Rmf/CrpP family protein [Thiococcus pfennigii]MBK1699772.1 hypothetical protein [Thiococcus pfennigii]
MKREGYMQFLDAMVGRQLDDAGDADRDRFEAEPQPCAAALAVAGFCVLLVDGMSMATRTDEIDPREDGREAYLTGRPLSSCPFPEGDERRIEWEGAWMEAEEEGCE